MKKKLLEYKLDLEVIKLARITCRTGDPKSLTDLVFLILTQVCLTEGTTAKLKMDLPPPNN
jgi:hypothetical protein